MTTPQTNLIEKNLVEETRSLLKTGKELLVKVAYNLHSLRESGEWKGEYESFPKYCQQEFELSQSSTSKYLTIADYYSTKYLPEEIGPVDVEKLYAAAKLPGTLEENLSRAKTWSRADFREQVAEDKDCKHEKTYTICSGCGTRVYNETI